MICCGGKSKQVFTCEIIMLDGTTINCLKNENIKHTTKVKALLDMACQNINLMEKEYFGLKYLDEHSKQHWLNPELSLNADPHFMKVTSQAPCSLFFGVKYYTADPCALKEEVTRYQLFLQLKQDMLAGKLNCSWNRAAELSALALQSEIGDYSPSEHKRGYVSEFRFIPHQDHEFESEVSRLHALYSGLIPSSAEMQYLKKCRQLDMYGVEVHAVKDHRQQDYQLGISPRGVETFRNKRRLTVFYWPQIKQVTHRECQLQLKVHSKQQDQDISTHQFRLPTPLQCKQIYDSITDRHAFYRLSNPISSSSSHSHKYGRNGGDPAETDGDVTEAEPEVVRLCSKRYPPRDHNDVINNETLQENVDPQVKSTSAAGDTGRKQQTSSKPTNNTTATTITTTLSNDKWQNALDKKSSMFQVDEDKRSVKYMTPTSERKERHKRLQTLSDNESRQHRRHRSRTGRSSGEDSDSPSKRRIKANKARRHRELRNQIPVVAPDEHHQSTTDNYHRRRNKHSHYYTDTEMFHANSNHHHHNTSSSRYNDVMRTNRKHHHHAGVTKHTGSAFLYNEDNVEDSRSRRMRRLSREDELARKQLWEHFSKGIVESSSMDFLNQNDIPYTEVRTSGNPNPRRPKRTGGGGGKRTTTATSNGDVRSMYDQLHSGRLDDNHDDDGMVAPLQITTTVGRNHRNHHREHNMKHGWDTRPSAINHSALSDYSVASTTTRSRRRKNRTPKSSRRSDNMVYTQI